MPIGLLLEVCEREDRLNKFLYPISFLTKKFNCEGLSLYLISKKFIDEPIIGWIPLFIHSIENSKGTIIEAWGPKLSKDKNDIKVENKVKNKIKLLKIEEKNIRAKKGFGGHILAPSDIAFYEDNDFQQLKIELNRIKLTARIVDIGKVDPTCCI